MAHFINSLLRRSLGPTRRPLILRRSFGTRDKSDSDDHNDDDDDDDDDGDGDDDEVIELNLEETEENFPRLGWSPGSFGARAERPSKARKPGQAVGRSRRPNPTEDEVWFNSGLYDNYEIEVPNSNKEEGKGNEDKNEK